MAPVEYPVIPEGETSCLNVPEEQCLTDRQVGVLLADFGDALDQANAKLKWLSEYFSRLP